MRVLVTGGAGFIGSNFVRFLLAETDYAVLTLDKLTYAGAKENIESTFGYDRHKFVEGDIRNERLVDDLVKQCDAIVNFAAETHVDRSIDDADVFASSNVMGTQTLLSAATNHDIRKFIQISTDEVYGEIHEGTFSEDACLNPRNPYAATKAGADLLAQSFYITHGLPVIITRSANNYGPNQHSEKLIPKLIDRASREEPLPLYGDGRNRREWTYVEDNCRAVSLLLEEGEPGEIYNISSEQELENIEVARKILSALGKSEELIEFVEDRPGHDYRYALDTSKLRTLGWTPNWSFDEGLQKTIEHYQT